MCVCVHIEFQTAKIDIAPIVLPANFFGHRHNGQDSGWDDCPGNDVRGG